MKQRLSVIFDGRVQGVGFRYTCINLSRLYNVTGYVKNSCDGKVELVCEGEKEQLTNFLNGILVSHLKKVINKYFPEWSEYKGEYKGFGIQY